MQTESTERATIESLPGSREGVRVMKLTGPLTIRNFFEFQDESRKDTSPLLIVDLGGVPYMDSAALGSLLGVHVSRERNRRKYALVRVSERLRTLFTVTGVQDLLIAFDTVEAAEAALLP